MAGQRPHTRRAAPPVLYEKQGPVAVVRLNRPEVHNAYNMAMRDSLYAALTALRDDPEVRVGVLLGNGPSFCSGGDVHEFGTAASPTAARAARWRRDVAGLLATLPKPMVVGVHGYAVGGGLEFALLCDLCVLSEDARLRYPETGLGTIPGVGGTQTTPRLAGPGRALEVLWSARWIRPHEAMAWGLAVRVVPRERLESTVLRIAKRLAALAPELLSASKRAVGEGLDLSLESALRLENRLANRVVAVLRRQNRGRSR
ncbi:MAG: enoyl-CoA hydratase/isomerase family protein [Candidatus Binatia bacterium]|nr:enoyl-CoA hydratase/isomerase family protein [Candidatus Binatia bacterium]